MADMYTVNLSHDEIRLLIDGLNWYESESAGERNDIDALRRELLDIIGEDA